MLDVNVTKSGGLLLYKHLLRVLQEQEPSAVTEDDLYSLYALSKSLKSLTDKMEEVLEISGDEPDGGEEAKRPKNQV